MGLHKNVYTSLAEKLKPCHTLYIGTIIPAPQSFFFSRSRFFLHLRPRRAGRNVPTIKGERRKEERQSGDTSLKMHSIIACALAHVDVGKWLRLRDFRTFLLQLSGPCTVFVTIVIIHNISHCCCDSSSQSHRSHKKKMPKHQIIPRLTRRSQGSA